MGILRLQLHCRLLVKEAFCGRDLPQKFLAQERVQTAWKLSCKTALIAIHRMATRTPVLL